MDSFKHTCLTATILLYEIGQNKMKIESLEKRYATLVKDIRESKKDAEKNVSALEKQVAELLSKYSRLSSSSKSHALLLDNYDKNFVLMNYEREENWKKYESLEKRNVTLEKDIRELRAEIKSKKDMEKNVSALEMQVSELKSTVADLQSASKSGSLLEKKVENLELRVNKVEAVDPSITLVDNGGDSKKPLVKLSHIDDLPAISLEPDLSRTSMEQEFGYLSDDSADDVGGCVIVLISLVTVLIGLHL